MDEDYKKHLFEQMYQAVVDQNGIREKASKDYIAACERFSAFFYEIKQAGLLNEYLLWKREEHGRSKGGQAQ